MKLRLGSVETRQTHKLDVSDESTLHQLKQILLRTLHPQNPSSPSTENIHLSLNRKDELRGGSGNGEDTLQSLGITCGDLIFFSLDASAFSTPNSEIALQPSPNSQLKRSISGEGVATSDESRNPQSALESEPNLQSDKTQKDDLVEGKVGEVLGEGDDMEIDGGGVDEDEGNVGKSFSVPVFLRKVVTEELGNNAGRHHEMVVIAIHAVMLESGLVAFDPASKTETKGFQFRNNWPTGSFALSLYYTLPQMINSRASDTINTVVLKFHSLSKCMTVYGSSTSPRSVVHRVNFDENKLVPFLNVVWANCGIGEEISVGVEGVGTSAEKEVFDFWRNVKDRLALPLLIDLCEKGGLILPPCFMRLPTELELGILEFLPGVDVAKVSCVSSELRYLCSSDDLWKRKFVEQFGDVERASGVGYWKQKFVSRWENRKKRRKWVLSRVPRRPLPFRYPAPPRIGGDHDIWPHSGIIGGDYDRLPQPFGGVPPGLVGGGRVQSHVPWCNLDGSSNRTFI